MKINEMMEMVNRIPVDQTAKATPTVKNFLLEKLRVIRANRDIIEKQKIDKKTEEIMEAYRKNVGFDKKMKAIRSLQERLRKEELELIELGLDEYGELIIMAEHYCGATSVKKPQVRWHDEWLEVSEQVVAKVKGVQKLIKAVKGEIQTFNPYEQLETRMMLASTVGECMAIVNAVVGESILKIEKKVLGLTDKE